VSITINWQLNLENLIATTTDNGSNFVAALNSKGWIRLSCFGHCLDLAFQKCLVITHIDRAISCCNTLVAAFHQSWKKQRDLKSKTSITWNKLISAVKTQHTAW